RAAVDDDERAVFALALHVDAARDDLFSAAGLAEDEDRERRLRHLLEHAEHAAHLGRRADELAEAIGVADVDALLPRLRLDRDLDLADHELGLRRDDGLFDAERADEGAVRTAEIADENAFVDGADLAMNGADLRIGEPYTGAFVAADDDRVDVDRA